MRRFLFPFFAVFSLITQVDAREQPNIIVIYTDDHGWPDVGAVGIYEDLKTPHIDALAASGVRATNGYSTAPQCIPSRAGLLSGRSQNRFGVESNGLDLSGFNEQQTIAERLKAVGYATGQVGKWHLGPNGEIPTHGFDDVYSKNANRPCVANYTLAGDTIPIQTVDDKMYHLDACSEAAVTFIDRHEQKPFFLYLAYRAPHVPLDAPEKYLSRFPGEMPERRRQALAMISAMDDGIGKIVASLKQKKLDQNTLIFFIGDNGAPLKIHKIDAPGGGPGWDGSLNEPMNGEKGMLAEGGIRVPFIVSWPGTIPGNQVYDHPVWSLDVAATSIAIAGLPGDDKLDGVNLIPYLSGANDQAPHEFIHWRWIAQSAVRKGKWKFLKGGSRRYLFDLDADPGESKNLAGSHAELAATLEAELTRWANEMTPPGIDVSSMSKTWEKYFDYYMDGEDIPLSDGAESTGDWIARNGKLKVENGRLKVTPVSAKKPAFIVAAKQKLSGAFVAKVELASEKGGEVTIAWRTADQKDFVKENTVSESVDASSKPLEVALPVPAKGKTIHVRIILPAGVSEISRISLGDRSWKF